MIRQVLGVKIDDVSLEEALEKVSQWSENLTGISKIIVTPGPEFLLSAQKDEKFRKILNDADLSLPDGFGLNLYAGIKNRVPGRIFMEKVCEMAAKRGLSIGFVGGWEGDGIKVRKNLEEKFPGIKISLVIDGEKATRIKNDCDVDRLIKKQIDVVFVGFGHPWQERVLWAIKNRKLKIKIAVGIGGAIDYLAGRFPEPPKFLVIIGQEWLWRLVTQPWRVGRILRATILFPFVLLFNHGQIRS